MPFKSQAQVRKFGALMRRGKISKAKFDEWAHATDMSHLPERKDKTKYVRKALKKRYGKS